ncbi:MAG: DUF308 domain-containing protein [Lachnospiraceae bacterium]|nr:DUF308 domain-containing protein [Lachnospiraceae bacterium]
MTVVSIILGVILIIGGFSCMMTPGQTLLSTGYFLGIMMFVYGIFGIIKAFQKRNTILETVVSVLAVIVGLVALFRPGSTLAIDAFIVFMTAFWFLFRGILSVVLSIRMKDVNKNWIWGLILGIICAILGLYSFAHPYVTALAVGFLIGFYFIEAGIDLIFSATLLKSVTDGNKIG